MSICNFCFNAHVYEKMPKTAEEEFFDTGLDDTNDGFSGTVGTHSENHQVYINSGGGKPVNIETCEWVGGRWQTVAVYYPKYCPECGRALTEYDITERGASFNRSN